MIEAKPDKKRLKEEDPLGELWEKDPDSCCDLRKTWPLSDITKKYKNKGFNYRSKKI